ncbi:MAG: queuosine precursor transporter [Candidatus Levybacteria bacterium]|nr:queuosine precursor transporter [Candidatus Levybacteria bacterium]
MFKIRKFDLLLSVYIFCIAVSELMGAKTFPIINTGFLKLNASVAIFVIPLIFTITDIIIEVYGKERAHSMIRSGLIVIFLLLIFSIIATTLPPSKRFLPSEKAYDDVFVKSIRISAASLTAFAISAFLDAAVFVKIRKMLGKTKLWFRNNTSNFVSQFSDTIIFITLAFYALDKGFSDNSVFLISLIIPYWLLKCFMSVIETPLVYLGVSWLKKDKSE